MTHTIFIKAKRHAERAIARGDIEEADRWTRIMRDHLAATHTIIDLVSSRRGPKPKPKVVTLTRALRAKLAAEDQSRLRTTPAMPVMLDPDGYSPGGTPNWFRNQQRLERAGLPLDLAPKTKARRQSEGSQHPTKT